MRAARVETRTALTGGGGGGETRRRGAFFDRAVHIERFENKRSTAGRWI
jgi:hypothetical protein